MKSEAWGKSKPDEGRGEGGRRECEVYIESEGSGRMALEVMREEKASHYGCDGKRSAQDAAAEQGET